MAGCLKIESVAQLLLSSSAKADDQYAVTPRLGSGAGDYWIPAVAGVTPHSFPNARFNSPLARSSRSRCVFGSPLPARLI